AAARPLTLSRMARTIRDMDAHTITLTDRPSLVVKEWACSCGASGITGTRGLSATAVRSRLLARAEQHLDDSGAAIRDFDALTDAL
ncbi:MAG: hypothetical protein JWM84_3152, partial [Nocardioides sp.]|nr:hypothetical protein [Nocardioides sp.]